MRGLGKSARPGQQGNRDFDRRFFWLKLGKVRKLGKAVAAIRQVMHHAFLRLACEFPLQESGEVSLIGTEPAAFQATAISES
jgi:hypothetical protein